MIYPATWAQLSAVRWEDLQTWAQPFAAPTGKWLTVYAAWGDSTAQLTDLSPGVGYDVQIRAVDKTGNVGAWSATTTFVTSEDNLPPSTPAAPTVAASRIAVQVTHTLGKSTGGTYNLESDLHHFEIHVDHEPTFTPSTSTLKGKVSATAGMIQAQIPVVATVQVEEVSTRYVRVVAVDQTGNKSSPSDAASSTALLIDDAHISDLTVTKVTAGTISADFIVGARIKTADTGARVELNSGGIGAWNAAGTQTVSIAGADGSVSIIGQLKSGTSGKRIEINPTATFLPEIRWYANTGTDFGYINAVSSGTDVSLGMNSSPYDDSGVSCISRIFLTNTATRVEVVRADDQDRRGGYLWAAPGAYYAGFVRAGVEGGKFYADGSQAKVSMPNGGQFYADVNTATVGWDDGSANNNTFLFGSGYTRHIGKWRNYVSADTAEGIFTGSISSASSVSGTVVIWGPTMDTPLYPVATIRDSPANYVYNASTPTTTSASLDYAIATTGASAVHFWCWRM
jgi:hypothetical protein